MQPHSHPFHPVHWVDGMKINKSHFLAQHDAYTYQVAQGAGAFLNEHNYGVLPHWQPAQGGLELTATLDNQRNLQIRLHRCRAITAGGYMIDIDESMAFNDHPLQVSVSGAGIASRDSPPITAAYLVVLVVNPYQRVPFGPAHPDETPTRLPYTIPSYSLELLPVEETSRGTLGYFQLPVGRLKTDARGAILDDVYIAPCTCLKSQPELVAFHASTERFFVQMEALALRIIQKILQKKQDNERANILQKLCEHIACFTAARLGSIKTGSLYQPPVLLIDSVAGFARLCKNTLDFYIDSGKEKLLTYCAEMCNVTPGELDACIATLASHQYNHLDINDSLDKARSFTALVNRLFAKLVDLEYIGERAGRIVVDQRIVSAPPEVPAKKRESFLVHPKDH